MMSRANLVMIGLGGAMIAALAGTAVVATISVSNKQRANAGRQFAAPTYRWPAGCPPRAYVTLRRVPAACAAPRYRLGSVWNLGLAGGGKSTYWYRLGDDAVMLRCPPLAESCTMTGAVVGKFIRGVEPPR